MYMMIDWEKDCEMLFARYEMAMLLNNSQRPRLPSSGGDGHMASLLI